MMLAGEFAASPAGLVTVTVVSALLVGMLTAAVKLVPRVLGDLAEIKFRMTGQDAALASIGAETHTNNGGSLKDAVIRIETQTLANGAAFQAHLNDAAYERGKVESDRTRLDAYIAAHP